MHQGIQWARTFWKSVESNGLKERLRRLEKVSYYLCTCQDNFKNTKITETNYDRDVQVSLETFYDVIFVAMVTKTLLKF